MCVCMCVCVFELSELMLSNCAFDFASNLSLACCFEIRCCCRSTVFMKRNVEEADRKSFKRQRPSKKSRQACASKAVLGIPPWRAFSPEPELPPWMAVEEVEGGMVPPRPELPRHVPPRQSENQRMMKIKKELMEAMKGFSHQNLVDAEKAAHDARLFEFLPPTMPQQIAKRKKILLKLDLLETLGTIDTNLIKSKMEVAKENGVDAETMKQAEDRLSEIQRMMKIKKELLQAMKDFNYERLVDAEKAAHDAELFEFLAEDVPARIAKRKQMLLPEAQKQALAEGAIIVISTAENDEDEIAFLLGEYHQEGSNHGRRFYRRILKNPGDVNVDLYYWDESDGQNFSGWWFGHRVGDEHMWARNQQSTQMPPRIGWRIPWDGQVKRELRVVSFDQYRFCEDKI